LLQSYIQEAFGRFKEIVKQGRPVFRDNEQALDKLATGEIFSATQAQKNGLVDEIGFIEKAIDRAVELAKLKKSEVRVVTYKAPLTLLGTLSAVRAPQPPSLDWRSVLDMSVPRAYYLMTSLPPLVSSP
jgi:protease-4